MPFITCLIGTILLMILTPSLAAAGEMPSIVPKPQQMTPQDDAFELTGNTRIVIADESLRPIAEYLAAHLKPATGFKLHVDTGEAKAGDIRLTTDYADATHGAEGYALNCGAAGVVISAPKPAGLFYGAQTLRQLFPPQIESDKKIDGVKWVAAGAEIHDWPRFGYRGFMLDSARHMQSVEFIQRTLDLMALYKLNRFHWHLTDDQGWRIEMKKYPKLTEIGAYRAQTMGDGTRYGGFYTQDQIRQIVQYAADRFITVIPEVDMPGHMNAALASYPNLGCTGGPYAVRTQWGIEKDVLCAGNPETYEFVKGVLDEVCQMFPSEVIHIGGDECPRDRWKECEKCQAKMKAEGIKDEDGLQNYFTHYVAKYLESKGRRLQGWNEIMKGGDLPQTSIVHVWNNDKDTTAAAKSGRDVVYSRTSFLYFDYPWERVSMAKVYSCEPVPAELSSDEAKHILGLQANLWTERRPTDQSCDEFTWPRLCAMAEVAWTDIASRNYDDLMARMKNGQYERLSITHLGASQDEAADKIATELAQRGAIEQKANEKKK